MRSFIRNFATMYYKMEDTICAPATAQGGAIGIVRVSGSNAISIVDILFDRNILDAKPYSLHYGRVVDKDKNTIDDVLLSVFRAPHSYTGENSVEISCHGSSYIINKILELLIQNGCRMATAGEFTQRAFLNGKMDLTQAEAVADLIASRSKAAHKVAMAQLKGHFSSELSALRDQLLKLTSLLELELDFSDHEDLEFADRSELMNLAKRIDDKIKTLILSFETGQALKKGIPVAIVGKTNVGKSTLLNRLLKDDRAIVSDVHGTTRDTIEDTIEMNGVLFRFIDTAGIRQTNDRVEKEGIARTYKKIEEATVIVWITDEQPSIDEIDEIKKLSENKQLIVAQNKADLLTDTDKEKWISPLYFISAKNGNGINDLEQAIIDAANIPEIKDNDVVVTSARHYEALKNAQDYLNNVIDGLKINLTGDLLAEDLRMTLSSLAEITGGQITPQETLNNIFSHFCVGK